MSAVPPDQGTSGNARTPQGHIPRAGVPDESSRPAALWWSPDPLVPCWPATALSGSRWRVVEVGAGADPAAYWPATRPDVALLDCGPDPTAAFDACARLRAAHGPDWVPMVAFVRDDARAIAAAAERDFDAVLTWPASAALLRAHLELLLRSRGARRELRLLADAARFAPTALALFDARRPGLPVVFVNAACEALGARRAGLAAELAPSQRHMADWVRTLGAVARGERRRLYVQLSSSEDGPHWADVAAAPLLDAAGHVTHVVLARHDVTSGGQPVTRQTQALAQRTAALEALFDQIPAGVVTADRARRVSFVNRAASSLLGLQEAECLGRDVVEVFGGGDALARPLADLPRGGETRLDFTLAATPHGARDVGMTLVHSGPAAPDDVAFLLLFRDLGQRRAAEMELRRVERLNAIGIMVAGYAHEVRNPLAGIHGLAEALLAETPPEDPRREYGVRIMALLGRVEHIVKTALRYGDPRLPARRRHAPLTLMLAARDALAARWEPHGGTPPALHAEQHLPHVEVDDTQIVESLLELIENALDAAGDPARVSLHVAVADAPFPDTGARAVRFDVRDDGPGVDERDLAHAFDPFYTTKPQGTGLGLAVAQTLVRANGGHLLARSVPGQETVFSVVFPEARS